MQTLSIVVITGILVSWVIINIFIKRRKPKPVTNITFQVMEINDMKQATVKLLWVKSVSTDVVSQRLTYIIGDADPVIVDLPASVEEFAPLTVPEKTAVHAELYPTDGTNSGDVATLDFTLGDLTKPEPITGFGYEVVEVVDVP
jgi:hypothetical protein